MQFFQIAPRLTTDFVVLPKDGTTRTQLIGIFEQIFTNIDSGISYLGVESNLSKYFSALIRVTVIQEFEI